MRAFLCAALFAAAFVNAALGQTTLRFGLNSPAADNPDYQGIVAFKDYVEFNSGGRVKIQLFPGGQLGSERQMTEQVRDGALDIAYVADGNMTSFYPRYRCSRSPICFPPRRLRGTC